MISPSDTPAPTPLSECEAAREFLADWWSDAPAGGILFVKDEPEFYAHKRMYRGTIDGDPTDVLVIAPHEHPLDAVLAHMRGETAVPHPPKSYYDDILND